MNADLTPAAMPGGVRLRPAPLGGGDGQGAELETPGFIGQTSNRQRTPVVDLTICTPKAAGAPLRVQRVPWSDAEPSPEEKPVSLRCIRVWEAARQVALRDDGPSPRPRLQGVVNRLLLGGIVR